MLNDQFYHGIYSTELSNQYLLREIQPFAVITDVVSRDEGNRYQEPSKERLQDPPDSPKRPKMNFQHQKADLGSEDDPSIVFSSCIEALIDSQVSRKQEQLAEAESVLEAVTILFDVRA